MQFVVPPTHERPHVPAEQTSPLAPGFPQLPQFVTLVSAVSQPLRALASQFPQLAPLQTGTHAPAAQLVLPCALVQAAPQLPQLSVSVRKLTSQPLAAVTSQSA